MNNLIQIVVLIAYVIWDMKQIEVKRSIISPGKSMMDRLYIVHLLFFHRNLAVTNRIKCFADLQLHLWLPAVSTELIKSIVFCQNCGPMIRFDRVRDLDSRKFRQILNIPRDYIFTILLSFCLIDHRDFKNIFPPI